jgi:mono/diheme cytochrome c family protein
MAQQAGVLDGKSLFEANCARCHTKGFSFGEPDVPGGGAFGPNLTNGDTLRQFPDIKDQITFITTGSLFQKPYGVRGIGSGRMPGFGRESDPDPKGKTTPLRLLTDDQIRAIAVYERSL